MKIIRTPRSKYRPKVLGEEKAEGFSGGAEDVAINLRGQGNQGTYLFRVEIPHDDIDRIHAFSREVRRFYSPPKDSNQRYEIQWSVRCVDCGTMTEVLHVQDNENREDINLCRACLDQRICDLEPKEEELL